MIRHSASGRDRAVGINGDLLTIPSAGRFRLSGLHTSQIAS
jgi:hypothetical protein